MLERLWLEISNPRFVVTQLRSETHWRLLSPVLVDLVLVTGKRFTHMPESDEGVLYVAGFRGGWSSKMYLFADTLVRGSEQVRKDMLIRCKEENE